MMAMDDVSELRGGLYQRHDGSINAQPQINISIQHRYNHGFGNSGYSLIGRHGRGNSQTADGEQLPCTDQCDWPKVKP